MTYQITAVAQNLSINVIRQLADEIWGEHNYSLNDDYKRTKNGDICRSYAKVYSMVEGHWKTGKEMVTTLLKVLEQIKGEKVELKMINGGVIKS